MKKFLLLFVVLISSSVYVFSQQDNEKLTAKFKYSWKDYLLPKCSFLIYHGDKESYFIDSLGNRVPNHSYINIQTGGKRHFIVENEEGFHILDTHLDLVTKKPYDNIERIYPLELTLTSGDKKTYFSWQYETDSYAFTNVSNPPGLSGIADPVRPTPKLGVITDSRFKSKRIERLRLGIDMSKTLSVGQKGKNVLIKKGDQIVYKGSTKPMLFYDFAITGAKGPHSIYHPISKDPILENCDRFWFVGSTLVVSVKGSPRKHIISNTGEIILSSAGEIRYYNYEFGGHNYAFFCDGRSVINVNGGLVYKSDGELIGVGEHYIYSGYTGAYLGDLSHTVKMDCSSFTRYHNLTIGKTSRNEFRLYTSKSVLVNKLNKFSIDENDSLLICFQDSKTIVCDPMKETIVDVHPIKVEAKTEFNERQKYFVKATDDDGIALEGRFDPKDGIVVKANYLKIQWPESEEYYIVLTKSGDIRYLNSEGQELFD